MATKAAHKRVCFISSKKTSSWYLEKADGIFDCFLTVDEGVCCYAKGAATFRMGLPGREKHTYLCVSSSTRERLN
jgi:hypothetical protein